MSPINRTTKILKFVKDIFTEQIKTYIIKEYIDNCSQKTASTSRKEINMAIKNTSKRVDKKVFKRTAASTKKINIAPKTMRGGIRL